MVTMSMPPVARRKKIQPLVVRITHWVNAVSMVIMIGSGWRLFNDSPLFLVSGLTGPDFLQLVIDQFDVLYEESKRRSGGVMAVCLHPFLVNQPFRHKYIDQALAYVRSHDDVWFTTSDDIADWYLTRCYAEARQALDAFSARALGPEAG